MRWRRGRLASPVPAETGVHAQNPVRSARRARRRLTWAWAWNLRADLEARQRQGAQQQESTDRAVAASERRQEELQAQGNLLRTRARDNQFAQLIIDCLDGLLYRKPGGRPHGTRA